MKEVVIVSAVRTPIGDFLGALSSLSAVELGTLAAEKAVARAGLAPDQVQDVAAGMIYKAGAKGNPARQIQIAAGFPDSGAALTVDQQCGSGMRAIEILAHQIMLGRTEAGVAVGTESMSQAPYVLHRARQGFKMGDAALQDTIMLDGLNCALCNYHMGVTAENLAEKYSISRQEQDELAVLSHARAVQARESGVFKGEIIPVPVPGKKGAVTLVEHDEHPRATDMETLARLRPAFKKDGSVTAGNASGINDGAAALVMMSRERAEAAGLKPLARLLATASAGVAPEIMGIGPVYALPKALAAAGLALGDIDYFEINEAFAAQFLACNRELKLPMDTVNANGSGIGLGHPVGATGARIVVSLIHEMKRRGARYGAASLCVGGGPAIAAVLELL